jgi:NifU-like protein involved in Fe-S cluster formation
MHDGVVVEFGQDVKACALGQASASILGAAVLGRNLPQLQAARDAVGDMLTANGPVPAPPFEGYQVLIPARDYKNRHASILLALDAAIEAATKIES